MITLNSTILSYNKIREIEEYKPMLPPDSIYIQNESINRSFQKFIPDIYDLDKINFKDFNLRRTLTPRVQNQEKIKKYFGSSIIINKKEKSEKYMESVPNIYTNEKEKSINYTNFNEIDFKKEKIINTNIYKNERNKINDNIINNLNIKKISHKKNINTNFNHNEEISLLNNNDNTNIITSQKTSLNRNRNGNGNESQRFDQNSAHSAFIKFNYKNIMRKDPTKENTYIFNTSYYKKKHKNGNKKNSNKSEINRNSFNSFLKFEESIRDSHFRTTTNKKEEILKTFMNSNSNINNSKLEKSNINSYINDYSNNIIDKSNINNNTNFDIEEKDNENENEENENEYLSICEDKKSIKCNNLTNYTFRTGKSGVNNIMNKGGVINPPNLNNANTNINDIFNTNESKKTNMNIKYAEPPILNYNNNINSLNTNNSNINKNTNKLSKKPNIGSGSALALKKFNFDFPKKIKENEYSKDEDNHNNTNINNILSNEFDKKINNNIKKNIKSVKFSNMLKILHKNGLFNVLTFLDCYDLMCMLKTKNRALIILINKAIIKAYYDIIKENLIKFKNDFELLKCSLIYTKVKDALKIDFVINIRFVNNINNKINDDKDKKDFFNLDTEDKIVPKCFQVLYFYNYIKSMYPQQKLKTKENTKKIKMYDYYTYDLYPESDKLPNIYINKEHLLFKNSNNSNNDIDKLLFIQPILPFKINDKGIINLEIYTSNNDFVNPSSIKIILKCFDLKKYLNDLNVKGYNNLRICEYENICFHWKLISNENSKNKFKDIIKKIENNFKNLFYIQDISYESIGYFIFKINLLAVRPGKIDNSKIDNDFGINIIIRSKRDAVENEIKKNSLLLERREVYEMRVGDTITLYFSTKIKK